jgi:N-acetylglucosaminyldiphosphoundecaprenol N-acetyl-beta-D-mannosaminyltransferase
VVDLAAKSLRPTPVLATPSLAGDLDAAACAVIQRAHAHQGGYACLCNVHVLVLAQRDARVREALDSAWAVFADGWPVAWLQRRAGAPFAVRVAGTDLMLQVLERDHEGRLSHFLFGSSSEVLGRMQERLRETFPKARIAGSFAPPYGEIDEIDFRPSISAIRATSPDIVWCGLGAPKQELWMLRHGSQIAPAVVVGVGAAFDFIAGAKPRAPQWAQDAGVEWVHRLASEPRRLFGRYATTGFFFLCYSGSWLVRNRMDKSERRTHADS